MKLAVEGYAPGKGFRFINQPFEAWEVWMDGRQLLHCVAADDSTGVAWRHRTDAEGNIVIDHEQQSTIVERVYGPVRLRRKA